MSRNRRNKRKLRDNLNLETLSNKNFITISIGFLVIIVFCISVLGVRSYFDQKEVARQKEVLDRQIKAIFEDTKYIVADEDTKETTSEEINNNIEKNTNEIANQTINEVDNTNENNKSKIEPITIKQDTIVNIAVTGDILCNNQLMLDAKKGDGYDFSHMFSEIGNLVKSSDITIGTMETNFVANKKYSDYTLCNSPKEFAKDVKDSGIDLISLAHNHVLDYGYNGLIETKDYLDSLGFDIVGVKTKEETENKFIIKDLKGIKVAFLGYTYGVNSSSSKSKQDLACVNIYSNEVALNDINKAKQQADFVFIIMHWGEVNSTKISKKQEEIGKFLVENGADVIIGSHPAVVEPMEIIEDKNGDNKFIAYSVGNYTSYLGYEYSSLELILDIQVRKDAKTGKTTLDKVTYTPIYVLDYGNSEDERFKLVDIKEVAKKYAYDNSDVITKKQYNELIKGLEKIESVVRSRTKNAN